MVVVVVQEGQARSIVAPSKLSLADADTLEKMAAQAAFASAQVYADTLVAETTKPISRWTARRHLKAVTVNVWWRVAARKPLLTQPLIANCAWHGHVSTVAGQKKKNGYASPVL